MIMELKKTEDEEGKIVILQQQLEDAQNKNFEFALTIEALSTEIDCLTRKIFEVEGKVREREEGLLRRIEDGVCEIYEGVREREELVGKIDLGMRENKRLLMENEVLKGKNEEFEKNLLRGLSLIKECLMRVNDTFDEKELENMKETMSNFEGKMKDCRGMEDFIRELNFVWRMVIRVEEVLGDYGGKEVLFREIRAYKNRIKELEESLMKDFKVLDLIKDSLVRINESLDENKVQFELDHECHDLEEKLWNFDYSKGSVEVMNDYFEKLEFVITMAKRVEEKMNDYQEKVRKEKKELERSVMSLTEENRDFSSLLRIALIEKEEVEKSLSKLKDSNEQRRAPLLQFAERGLQRVGFGFIVGGSSNEQCKDQNKISDQTSDSVASNASSEYEEEVVDLASTMEKMIKNTRLEITQLQIELEESRSDTERLQSLTEKQTHQIHELTVYINELEDRERILTRNVEELNIELKETEAEADRWRQACEMEVEAGKCIAQEHNKLVDILKHELEKTRAALQVSDKRLKSKEQVAAAAMAAQAAAERSLQLADRRCAALHQRIEELTRQIDEVENREKHKKRRRRRICWPWQALYPANTASNVRRVLPEMQAFLR